MNQGNKDTEEQLQALLGPLLRGAMEFLQERGGNEVFKAPDGTSFTVEEGKRAIADALQQLNRVNQGKKE